MVRQGPSKAELRALAAISKIKKQIFELDLAEEEAERAEPREAPAARDARRASAQQQRTSLSLALMEMERDLHSIKQQDGHQQ